MPNVCLCRPWQFRDDIHPAMLSSIALYIGFTLYVPWPFLVSKIGLIFNDVDRFFKHFIRLSCWSPNHSHEDRYLHSTAQHVYLCCFFLKETTRQSVLEVVEWSFWWVGAWALKNIVCQSSYLEVLKHKFGSN